MTKNRPLTQKEFLNKKDFPFFTPKTITNKEEFEKELSKVRKQGFALDVGENEKDVRCVSLLLEIISERLLAAISIPSPNFRLEINK